MGNSRILLVKNAAIHLETQHFIYSYEASKRRNKKVEYRKLLCKENQTEMNLIQDTGASLLPDGHGCVNQWEGIE